MIPDFRDSVACVDTILVSITEEGDNIGFAIEGRVPDLSLYVSREVEPDDPEDPDELIVYGDTLGGIYWNKNEGYTSWSVPEELRLSPTSYDCINDFAPPYVLETEMEFGSLPFFGCRRNILFGFAPNANVDDDLRGSGRIVGRQLSDVGLQPGLCVTEFPLPSRRKVQVRFLVETDSPPAPPPGPSPVCFSGENTVRVRGKGEIAMKLLSVGDHVLVSKNEYSLVYTFLHRDADAPTAYLRIQTRNSRTSTVTSLEISNNHLLVVHNKMVRAEQAQVGDFAIGGNGEPVEITSIETVWRKGLFSPATLSGDIVVSDVLASNYAVLLHKLPNVNHHWLMHAVFTPVRIVCGHIAVSGCYQFTIDGFPESIKHAFRLGIKVIAWVNRTTDYIAISTVSSFLAALSAA